MQLAEVSSAYDLAAGNSIRNVSMGNRQPADYKSTPVLLSTVNSCICSRVSQMHAGMEYSMQYLKYIGNNLHSVIDSKYTR